MCKDSRQSTRMYVLATVLAAVLIHVPTDDLYGFRNVWVGVFSMAFALIQVIEALIWLMREVDADVHRFAVWIEPALWLQCVVQCAFWTAVDDRTPLLSGMFVLISSGLLVRSLVYPAVDATAYPGRNGHLVWSRKRREFQAIFTIPEAWFYMLALFLPLWKTEQWLQLLIGGLTCAYNLVNYWSTNEFASEWCYAAVYYTGASLAAPFFLSNLV